MRMKSIRRYISPPRNTIQRLRHLALVHYEPIILAANLQLGRRSRRLRRRSSILRIPSLRVPYPAIAAQTRLRTTLRPNSHPTTLRE